MRLVHLSATLFVLLAALPPVFSQAQAQPSVVNPLDHIMSIRQADQNNDGQPDVTIIRLAYATENDQVVVYDGGGDMRAGSTWQETTDFENDTWLFDTGADNTVQLVIQFQREGEKRRALIYNDLDGDGSVSTAVVDGVFSITEGRFPSIIAEVDGDWRLPDGSLNWNIVFYTDGDGLKLVDLTEFSARFTDLWTSFLRLDGSPDTALQFYDEDRDGIPEAGIWRLLVDTPADWGAVRTWIWSNGALLDIPEHPDYLFWPYLVTPRTGRYDPDVVSTSAEKFVNFEVANYFTTPPSIEVGWLSGLVSPALFRGYPTEQGFHMHSNVYFEPDRVNYANFEIAQAYYDLAQDRDTFPELHIRHRYFRARDVMGWGLPANLNEIRYSWNQDNQPNYLWDYKLGLAGRHSIDEQEQVGDFAYHAVPHAELPEWVTSHKWDIATFIAAEGLSYVSSEGIYDWGPVETMVRDEPSLLSRYLAGQYEFNLGQAFTTTAVGIRGEYTDYLNDVPWLYFSPMDRKLHLVSADACVWTLGVGTEIRCGNLNNDDYLDRWQYFVDGQLQSELIELDDLLILRTNNTIKVKYIDVPNEIFRTLPPTDHESWAELGVMLNTNSPTFAPADFEAMFNQFEGETSVIQGAHFIDFRLTEEGFRFQLQLEAGFEETLSSLLPSLANYAPGEYIVEMKDDIFTVSPMTGPDIALDISIAELPEDRFVAVPRLQLRVSLQNRSVADLKGVTLEVFAEPDNGSSGDRVWLAFGSVDLLGSETQTRDINWTPPTTGNWLVTARLTERDVDIILQEIQERSNDENVKALLSQQISYNFQNYPSVSRYQYLVLNGEQPISGIPIVILLIALAASAVALFWLIIVLLRKTQSD
jgi:catechol 2,3-dioxygenase-like lactoylglutathione lyase family enzyme